VSSDLVSLYITDHGAHTPNYIYRLFSEVYSHQDYNLDKEK
jgi:hypothetical protein